MNTKHTFFSLCKAYDKIEIPIIQRDYAQGRNTVDVIELRSKFIDDFLIDELLAKRPVELDFVYGSVIKEKKNDDYEKTFIPLDGQQRLTTLFLLFFYIAIKEKCLENIKHLLSKFTYETRPSAKDFCSKLLNKFSCKDSKNIKFEITNSNWFSEDWHKDPTISGMITMLDNFANNQKLQKADKKTLAQILDTDSELISFYFTDLDEFGLSENLYIRMNARGKMLSKFENFKSEFFKVISYDSQLTAQVKDKIEYKWVENLWQYKKKDKYIIDEPFMSFLSFVTQMLYFKDAEFRSSKGYENNFLNFKILENTYKKKENLQFLIFALDHISELRKLNKPILWNNSSVADILHEIILGKPETIDYFLLYATLRYLQENNNQDNLQDYLRVIRNLTQNTIDKSIREWPHILNTITGLITEENIYDFISKSNDNNIFRGFYSEQIKEEKCKATLISSFPNHKSELLTYEDNRNLRGKIVHLLKAPLCKNHQEFNDLETESISYVASSFKTLSKIYDAYLEMSKDDFINIWGDLLNTPIYYHDKYYHRIDYSALYSNCPSIFLFAKNYVDQSITKNLNSYLESIRKDFVNNMLSKNVSLELVRHPKHQLYLYYIIHININKKGLSSFFKNGYYNFGWLKKDIGYKSLYSNGLEDSLEFENSNPIFQVYNSQFRYSLGINKKNTLDIEIIGIGNKRNALYSLVQWASN